MDTFGSVRIGAPEAARLIGVEYPRLDYWYRHGWLQCRQPASGSGSRRELDFFDMVLARCVAHARQTGVEPGTIGEILREVEIRWHRAEISPETGVVVAGHRITWANTKGGLLAALTTALRKGMAVVLPVGGIIEDTKALLRREGWSC